MAYGDLGGVASQLNISCKAACEIKKGDPVALTGDRTVSSVAAGWPVFGIAMSDADMGGHVVVMARGLRDVYIVADPDSAGLYLRAGARVSLLVALEPGAATVHPGGDLTVFAWDAEKKTATLLF